MIQEDLQILLLLLSLAGIYAVWPLIRSIWEERRFIRAIKNACRKRRLSCAFYAKETRLEEAFDSQKRALFSAVTKALDIVVLGDWKNRQGAFRLTYQTVLHPQKPKKKLVVQYGIEQCRDSTSAAEILPLGHRIVGRLSPVFSYLDVARFEQWLDETE